MNTRFIRLGMALACAIVICAAPAPAYAADKTDVPHTLTWWCVDLNDVWNVKVPVILGRGTLQPPDPSPIPNPCTSGYPVQVPAGSAFVPGFTIWYTNKTYPPAVRDALEEMGYDFHSQSPAEDFMSKFVEIRVEVRTYPENALVAEKSFDPRKVFKLIRTREYFGQALAYAVGPVVDPDFGIDLSLEEVGRLPLVGFPVVIPAVQGPPGEYRIWMYWTMSDVHNDGMGMAEGNMLPAGEFIYTAPRFTVVP